MRTISSAFAAIAAVSIALPAAAEPTHPPGVFTLKPVEIYGRVRTPVAAVEIAKATPALAPAALVKSLANRIEKTVTSTAL